MGCVVHGTRNGLHGACPMRRDAGYWILDTGCECQNVWKQISEDRLLKAEKMNSADRIEYRVSSIQYHLV